MTAKQLAATTRTAERARLLLLVAVAAAIGHQAVYMAQFGVSSELSVAMASHGHPASVPMLLVLAVASSAAFVGIVVWRLRRLIGTGAVSESSAPATGIASDSFLSQWWQSTSRVVPAALVWYVVQENAEHLLVHGHLDGLSVLGGADTLFTVCVLAVVSAVVSLVGLLVRWPELVLEHRLASAAAARVWPRLAAPLHPVWSAAAAALRSRWILCRRVSGRAPPLTADV